ncbi:MAG TPA: ABC transporter ATP-binding protein [Thermodesulfobacteriota bacterium]|nr:ABC transporter ATP-binding protein [Thermodesulfobacteriota bacterium]
MALAIKAEGIYKTFRSGWWGRKEKLVLKGVDLQVEEGEIFGILGPNGAGKTTLLSILSTLLLPDQGRIQILGIDGLQNGKRIRERVNISSGNANFLWSLTVRENLHFYGMLYGLTGNRREEKVKALIHLFNLEEHQDVHFDRLSTGMKQRLSLAKSLLNDPAVLFLDEPTVGLDPSVSVTTREQIRLIQKQRGMTVLLTTHNMREAEFLCDRIAFLKNGEILTTGTAATLKRMIRMGDLVKIYFKGMIPEDELARADGVINCGISEGLCEVIVDDGEKRLASLIALLSQSGVQIKRVTLGQTDLEDVFIEFASQPSREEEP